MNVPTVIVHLFPPIPQTTFNGKILYFSLLFHLKTMKKNEVIIVDGIPQHIYDSLINACVKYAIISVPFTINRMAIADHKKRALNIAKGKIAEHLFQYFCEINHIPVDFKSCETEFWTVDNRDFILDGKEWDIKNNFIYTENEVFKGNYTDLPALIPNRFKGDQWSKRLHQKLLGTNGVVFLFTFLRNATKNRQGESGFLEINLTDSQLELLRTLYAKYGGIAQTKEPFSEERFWEEMNKRGQQPLFRLNSRPHLVITGYADADLWNQFRDTGPNDVDGNWKDFLKPFWYSKAATGSCSFLEGTLWTKITNATLPVFFLKPFSGLFPQLETNIQGGRRK